MFYFTEYILYMSYFIRFIGAFVIRGCTTKVQKNKSGQWDYTVHGCLN